MPGESKLDQLRQCIGTPWKHQGRKPGVGLDCAGLGAYWLALNGIRVRDRKDYGRDPDGSLWDEMCRCLGEPIAQGRNCAAKALPGDVALMEYTFGAHRHVGVIGDAYGLSLIHADSNAKKVIEHPLDARWARRIVGVWRLPL